MGKNIIIFGADMSSSVHIDNKNKDILIPGEETTQWLDDTTLTAEAIYPINFTELRKRLLSSQKVKFSIYWKISSVNVTKCASHLLKKSLMENLFFLQRLLSLCCNGSNSLLFVNAAKIYQFKAKDSEMKGYALCLGNISKDFTLNNMKKQD